jgi:hypothetical protein
VKTNEGEGRNDVRLLFEMKVQSRKVKDITVVFRKIKKEISRNQQKPAHLDIRIFLYHVDFAYRIEPFHQW